MANSIQYKLYLPPGFLDKRINEQVIFDFVDQVRHYSVWRRGDPLRKEPDFVCDGEGLEVTFASSDYSTRNFIGDFCDGVYSPLEAQEDHTQYIQNALERKAKKTYATPRTSLAILCMLELFCWTEAVFIQDPAIQGQKRRFLDKIAQNYLGVNRFYHIYLILPGLMADWYVLDVTSNQTQRVKAPSHADLPYFRRTR